MTRDDEALFLSFVDRFVERGDDHVPAEWPDDLRRRCRLFLALRGRSAELGSRSLIAALDLEGLGAETLDEVEVEGESSSREDGAARQDDERYVVESELGRGGMGRVLLAVDRDLRRRVAMKVLLAETFAAERVARFLEEAQATAQLEHPNIAPVYDLGVDASGAPFFTMKWIRGRDLEEILRSRESSGEEPAADEPSLVRLVQILQQAAMGVDFAHSRGVVHRDLKPQNVMVGDYGEVLVVDWGLAKLLEGGADDDPDSWTHVTTDRSASGGDSLVRGIAGSLAYMAPEQARGENDRIDARTDVYGLGGILYRLLTGEPPHVGASIEALLERAREGSARAPAEHGQGRTVPAELDRICRRALAPEPSDRFHSARELHDALQAWVEGIHDAERRAREARDRLAEAAALEARLHGAERRHRDLRERESALRASIEDHAPPERKRPLWDVVDRAGAAREEAAGLFSRVCAAYQAVLSIDGEHRSAHRALAGLYVERLREAERRSDLEAIRLYEGLVELHDDGRLAAELRGEGDVSIRSSPPAERITLSRYDARGLLRVAARFEQIDGPRFSGRLPNGSWLAVLERDGCRASRVPFVVARGRPVEIDARLLREASLPPGFEVVAAGESTLGSDAEFLAALPRSTRHVEGLLLGRFPVTLGEFARLLDDLRAGARSSEDVRRLEALVPSFGRQEYLVPATGGGFEPNRDLRLEPDTPVMGVSSAAVDAYLEWARRALGSPVRLPTEDEWERAARGADGRLFVWGDVFDWALCKGARSRPGQPWPEPVGAFASDVSPFGVRDLTGGVRELCAGWFEEGCTACRGGSWFQNAPLAFRAEYRSYLRIDAKTTDVGFRLALALPEE